MKLLIPKMNLKKKKNTIKKIAIVLFIVAVALTLESCRNGYRNSEFDRALNVFFITISQITNIVILGTLSLVFSIIGSTSPKHGYRVVGSICTGIFGFFTFSYRSIFLYCAACSGPIKFSYPPPSEINKFSYTP